MKRHTEELLSRRGALLGAAGWVATSPWANATNAPSAGVGPAPASFAPIDLEHALALRAAGLRDTLAWQLTASLVTEVGPRAAGTPGEVKAVEWALANLKRLGLANVRAEPVTLTAWQRGPMSARLTSPLLLPLVATTLGNSVGTPDEGFEAELAYYSDFEALKADASDRARGRIVFIDQTMERTRDGSGYGRAVLARIAGAVEASRRGARAVAIRSIGTDRDRIAHTGAMRYDPAVGAIPAIAVSVPDAEQIATLHAQGQPLRMALSVRQIPATSTVSQNVVAEVPGTDLAHEIVLIGAHLDTWDITPGAQDDGVGVGISTAAAKLLQGSGRRPRRTVRLVLFANEENGFDGAHAYAARYKDQTHQLVGESDFGAGKIWRLRSRVLPQALPAVSAMTQLLAPLGIDSAANNNQGNPGPDAAMLMRARGWPGIELTQDGTNYFDVHHTVNDTLERIDPATLPQNVAAWAVVAWLAAQSAQPFGPLPTPNAPRG